MPQNLIYLPANKIYGAERLHGIAKRIVDLAFFMGGSRGLFYKAVPCNYTFPNGQACYDSLRGTHSVECPVCRGNGVYYKDPVETQIIVMDSPQKLFRDKYGGIFTDSMRLSVPASIKPGILKLTQSGRTFVAKDKFVVKTLNNDIWGVVYVESEPKDAFLGGTLYYTLEVTTHLVFSEEETKSNPPVFYSDQQAAEILKQINKEVLGTEGDFISIENKNLVVSNGMFKINDPKALLDDWG